MTRLVVHTARIWLRGDPDILDITRATAGPTGVVFAPSDSLLRRYKRDRRAALSHGNVDAVMALWNQYVIDYTIEMRDSYETHRKIWDSLMARKRVVLVCYCPTPDRCHRGILADILVKCGATYAGEISVDRDE